MYQECVARDQRFPREESAFEQFNSLNNVSNGYNNFAPSSLVTLNNAASTCSRLSNSVSGKMEGKAKFYSEASALFNQDNGAEIGHFHNQVPQTYQLMGEAQSFHSIQQGSASQNAQTSVNCFSIDKYDRHSGFPLQDSCSNSEHVAVPMHNARQERFTVSGNAQFFQQSQIPSIDAGPSTLVTNFNYQSYGFKKHCQKFGQAGSTEFQSQPPDFSTSLKSQHHPRDDKLMYKPLFANSSIDAQTHRDIGFGQQGISERLAVRTMAGNEQSLALVDPVLPMNFNPSSSQENFTMQRGSSRMENSALAATKKNASEISEKKPSFTLVAIIEMALKSATNNRLTLREIYEFMMSKFSYFRRNKKRWQNSVRHCLSFNDCFVKVTKDGKFYKNCYWTLHPEAKNMYANGNFRRRSKRFRCKESNKENIP